VGASELRKLLPHVTRAVVDRRVAVHRDDELLLSHLARAVATGARDGSRSLDTARSPGPITAARCAVWTAGELLRPAAPRPVIAAG
jgi:hypothetical protein